MIDRTNRETVSGHHAELTGIVAQLTTPSRNHSDLVDIWFGVLWSERDPEWEHSFARLANGRRPDAGNPSFFDLFSHSSNSGLIVARQVSAEAAVWSSIEDEARALVTAVNRDVRARHLPPPAPPSAAKRWTLRVRGAASFLASLRWVGDARPGIPSVADLPIQVSHHHSGGSR